MRGIKPVPEWSGSNEGPPPGPTDEDRDRLAKMNLPDMLVEARLAAIRQLLFKVQRHEASAAELAVLRNLLRDNGMILGLDAEDMATEEARGEIMGFPLPSLSTHDDNDEE